jgi:hypothetical protein
MVEEKEEDMIQAGSFLVVCINEEKDKDKKIELLIKHLGSLIYSIRLSLEEKIAVLEAIKKKLIEVEGKDKTSYIG